MLSQPGRTIVARRWEVAVVRGPDLGTTWEREDGPLTVGTASDRDLVLSDPSVSRRHAELHLLPDGVFVQDCGSKNGTRVASRRVEKVFLRPGEKVTLGRTELLVTPHDEVVDASSELASLGEFSSSDPDLRAMLARFSLVAGTETTILICGPRGTGRELLARGIHDASSRAEGPYVVVECGAFERADEGFERSLQRAAGGTLVLLELDRLPRELQPKLLASMESASCDLRVVAITSRDLNDLVDERRFMADLYYRVAVIRAEIPPLALRPTDIRFLAEAHARRIAGEDAAVTSSALSVLEDYDWPGNDRELRSIIERAVALSSGKALLPEHLFPEELPSDGERFHAAKERVISDFEVRYARALLGRHDGNVSAAAKAAGLTRAAVYALLKRTGLTTAP